MICTVKKLKINNFKKCTNVADNNLCEINLKNGWITFLKIVI